MKPAIHRWALGPIALALTLILASCGSDDLEGAADEIVEPVQDSDGASQASGESRDDVSCELDDLPADDSTEFLVVHYVVDGELGAVCLGEEDQTLLAAWDQLGLITPAEQLKDLALFSGFSFKATGDNETAAFVNIANEEGSAFQMSVNLDAYDADPDEASLTMAHEFSHVFTGVASQIDRSVMSADDCDTFYNTEGCYLPGSIMAEWIDLFWGDGLIEQIDAAAEPDPEAGADRCSIDARFLGSYAASSPEEDFAETFSAFVFQVAPVSDEVQEKFDWIAEQPALLEFQERAADAQLGPLDNNFEPCG